MGRSSCVECGLLPNSKRFNGWRCVSVLLFFSSIFLNKNFHLILAFALSRQIAQFFSKNFFVKIYFTIFFALFADFSLLCRIRTWFLQSYTYSDTKMQIDSPRLPPPCTMYCWRTREKGAKKTHWSKLIPKNTT